MGLLQSNWLETMTIEKGRTLCTFYEVHYEKSSDILMRKQNFIEKLKAAKEMFYYIFWDYWITCVNL